MPNWGTSTPAEALKCVACGQNLAGVAALVDIADRPYCRQCFLDLRMQDNPAVAPVQFRCQICADVLAASEFAESNGKLSCRRCLTYPTHLPLAIDLPEEPAAPSLISNGSTTPKFRETLPKNVLSKLTCPHCWHAFPPDQVLWISQHSELIGDPVLGPEAQLRFRPSRFNLQGEAIDGREMPCQLLACPRCHLIVPRAVVETEPLFLSIVGAPACGKSHFLAAMSWELRKLLPARFGITFNDADTLTNHALNSYEETLFLQSDMGQLVSIRKTELQGDLYDQIRLGQQVISLPRPFLFTIRPNTAGARVRLLCLYDNAGEHFQPGMDSISSPGTQHLSHSRAILFLFDPMQHPRFREACQQFSKDPQLNTVARNQRQEVMMNEAAARVRRYTGLSPRQKHKRPLLVIVSKADVWAPLLDVDLNQEPFTTESPAAVRTDQIEKVSIKLRKLLMQWTPEFVTAAEDFCQHVVYVPVSALGHPPELEEQSGMLGVRPKDITPKWVTVPMLYAFAKWARGLIPSTGGTGTAES